MGGESSQPEQMTEGEIEPDHDHTTHPHWWSAPMIGLYGIIIMSIIAPMIIIWWKKKILKTCESNGCKIE